MSMLLLVEIVGQPQYVNARLAELANESPQSDAHLALLSQL